MNSFQSLINHNHEHISELLCALVSFYVWKWAMSGTEVISCYEDVMINRRKVIESGWHTIGIFLMLFGKLTQIHALLLYAWSSKSFNYSNTQFVCRMGMYFTGFIEIGNMKIINGKCYQTVISRELAKSSSLLFPRRFSTCNFSQGLERGSKAYQKSTLAGTWGRACWLWKIFRNLIFQLALLLLLKRLQLLKPLDEQNT